MSRNSKVPALLLLIWFDLRSSILDSIKIHVYSLHVVLGSLNQYSNDFFCLWSYTSPRNQVLLLTAESIHVLEYYGTFGQSLNNGQMD